MDSLQILNGDLFKLIVPCLNWTQFDVIFYSKRNCKAVFWYIKNIQIIKIYSITTHLNIRWPWFQLWSSCFFTFRSTFVFHLFHFKLLELQQKEKLFVSCHLDLWFRTKELFNVTYFLTNLAKNVWHCVWKLKID